LLYCNKPSQQRNAEHSRGGSDPSLTIAGMPKERNMTEALAQKTIETKVGYLPAPKPFHHRYSSDTLMEAIREQAMAHFGVENHTDRNVHEFFLEFEGQRITNYGQTLEAVIGGKHHEKADFELVEQVTNGAR